MAPSGLSLKQPHINVEIAPLSPSKWEDTPKASTSKDAKMGPAYGYMMLDTGACVSVVTRRWAEDHGLTITPGRADVKIFGVGGIQVPVVGTTSMSIRLTRSLEVDVVNVTVQEGKSY